MDVTCGITFSTDSSTLAQLECALLSSNLEDIEKYSEKLKKKKEISSSLGIVLDCYVGIHRQIRLHAASLELDLTHLLAYQIKPESCKKLKDKLMKVLMTDLEGGSELELKLAYVLLALLSLFSCSEEGPKESLNDSMTFFDKIDFDLTKRFLLYEHGDTEITQSSLIEKIFGILGLYFRGVGLELQGRKEDACEQYQVIFEFIFRFRVQQFCQARSVFDFICAALYRSGSLLNQLAQFKESASIFRSFLNFYQVSSLSTTSTTTNATVRLLRALAQYMDLLDRKFRKYNFKTFCDEQQSIYNVRSSDTITWQAENVQEELILCCMLYEGIEQSSLVKKSIDDLRLEGSVLRRFAKIGYLEGITRIQKSHFQTKVSDLSIYRNLFHSLMSSGKFDQALLSGKMYLQGHGKDPFTLMLIAKLYMKLPSKFDESFVILCGINCEDLEVSMQVPYFLLRGQYHLIKSRLECQFVRKECETHLKLAESQFLLVLQVDPDNADAHFYLSLTFSELCQFDEAERLIKKSLSLDSSQIRAWNLFAILKSANKDYQSVLSICNTELSNMIERDFNLSLLRVSALMELNRSDEAIDNLKRIISAHLQPSNDFKMDGGMTIISEGTLGPGTFLSKFLGDLNGGFYGDCKSGSVCSGSNVECNFNDNFDILLGNGKSSTFIEYSEAFPSSLNEFLSSKTGFGDSNLLVEDKIALSSTGASTITALWIEVAKVYLQEGFLQDAEAAVNQAFLGNEIYSPIFGTFGLIEEHRKHDKENMTEMFYRKGLSIDEVDETCLLGLSRILLLKKGDESKIFESERLARDLIQKDPSVAEAWSLLAQCCSGSGRSEEASKYFEIALQKDSKRTLRSIRSIKII